MPKLTRMALAALLALSAACATAAAGGAALPGSWRLAQVNGRDLPAESPTEPGVTVTAGSLELSADGRAAMSLTARTASTPEPATRSMPGTYRTAADSLILLPGGSEANAARFRYQLAAPGLRLTDDRGNVYAFTRP